MAVSNYRMLCNLAPGIALPKQYMTHKSNQELRVILLTYCFYRRRLKKTRQLWSLSVQENWFYSAWFKYGTNRDEHSLSIRLYSISPVTVAGNKVWQAAYVDAPVEILNTVVPIQCTSHYSITPLAMHLLTL